MEGDTTEYHSESLGLEALSNSIKKFSEATNLISKNIPKVNMSYSLMNTNYMTLGGNSMHRVWEYYQQLSGQEEFVKKAAFSFIEICGLPHAVGKNSKIIEYYFELKGKELRGEWFYFMEPYMRKIVVDKGRKRRLNFTV